MLGQPASSQTVCRPSRRTRDFSSVYSGPVFRRVLIHSGLRSMGTWLLRTSRRSSLRPAGSSGEPAAGVGTAVSLMTCTVPAGRAPPPLRREQRGRRCRERCGQTCLSAGPAGGAASAPPPLVKGSGGPVCVVLLPGSSPSVICASRSPMSDSAGAESLVVSAVETVLPELLLLGTGSSR